MTQSTICFLKMFSGPAVRLISILVGFLEVRVLLHQMRLVAAVLGPWRQPVATRPGPLVLQVLLGRHQAPPLHGWCVWVVVALTLGLFGCKRHVLRITTIIRFYNLSHIMTKKIFFSHFQLQSFVSRLATCRWALTTWMTAGYGESAVELKLRPGVVLSEGACVARQYASRYSARCSQASSSWFSSRMMSNISCRGANGQARVTENWRKKKNKNDGGKLRVLTEGHWESFSAATSCTFKCLLWDLPRDLMRRWRT